MAIGSAPNAVVAFAAAAALGFALQALSDREVLLLHTVTLGASTLDAPSTAPGWLAVPLCVLDAALVWSSKAAWGEGSWWAALRGPVKGQLTTLADCAFTILPALLAAWLLWMPAQCSPLPCLLAAIVATVSSMSLLFWTSRLPLLPAADVTPACATASASRSLVFLLHAAYFGCGVALSAPAGECVAFAGSLGDLPQLGERLHEQMVEQTVQSMLSPATLVTQVCCLVTR